MELWAGVVVLTGLAGTVLGTLARSRTIHGLYGARRSGRWDYRVEFRLVRDLLPEFVVVEVAGDDDWTGALMPDEACACRPGRPRGGGANTPRDASARGGRCSGKVGIHGLPVLTAPSRAPVWPAGATGDITHTKGYCAVAVGRVSDLRALGIDAERHGAAGQHRGVDLPAGGDRLVRAAGG